MFPNFPSHFKFANLRKISLKQMEPSLTLVGEQEEQDERKRIPRLEEFLRQVLEQSEVLEDFKMEGEDWPDCPRGQYEELTLPRTVTRVQLDTRMNFTKLLDIQNGGWRFLEGITVLTLNVTTRNLLSTGEMERILEGVRMTLEELELISYCTLELQLIAQVVFKIPVMENLRRMRIEGGQWRVERSQAVNGVGNSFPLLEQLELCEGFTDELLLNEWCGDNSVFGKVASLKLGLCTEMPIRVGVGMSENRIRRILNNFPNVKELWMQYLDVGDIEGLRYMFGKLGGQLKCLHLVFRGYLEREEDMERILIGGDVDMVRRLKRKRWNGGKSFLKKQLESIRALRTWCNWRSCRWRCTLRSGFNMDG